ncbi:CLUMA_CG007310, isoform A [Clunio marinus]|uniref:CLUMA_CG007310, isoform A n=1 Tax=Clunio marinus TaxID=568069 RepID=A0A1J1I4H8_9DIPT|nr:CLUMA_CG007310, isoform A [Clunio marinus]
MERLSLDKLWVDFVEGKTLLDVLKLYVCLMTCNVSHLAKFRKVSKPEKLIALIIFIAFLIAQ